MPIVQREKCQNSVHINVKHGILDNYKRHTYSGSKGLILSESPVCVALALKLHHHSFEQSWKDHCGRMIHLLIDNPCKQKATQREWLRSNHCQQYTEIYFYNMPSE